MPWHSFIPCQAPTDQTKPGHGWRNNAHQGKNPKWVLYGQDQTGFGSYFSILSSEAKDALSPWLSPTWPQASATSYNTYPDFHGAKPITSWDATALTYRIQRENNNKYIFRLPQGAQSDEVCLWSRSAVLSAGLCSSRNIVHVCKASAGDKDSCWFCDCRNSTLSHFLLSNIFSFVFLLSFSHLNGSN